VAGGRVEVADEQVDVAEFVEGVGFGVPVTYLTGDGERSPLVLVGAGEVAACAKRVAQVVQRAEHAQPVGGIGSVECLPVAGRRFAETALQVTNVAEVDQQVGLLSPIAGRGVRLECPLEEVGCGRVGATPEVHHADGRRRLAGVVAPLAGGVDGTVMKDESVVVVAADVEIAPEDRGELHGMDRPAVCGRVGRAGKQILPFCVRPGLR
jgi:hypothetical protein